MNLASLSDIAKQQPFERYLWITHPNNRALLESALEPAVQEPGSMWLSNEIKFDPNVSERRTKQVWHPPAGDSFVEYEATDEAWMRPLGLGRVEEIDLGPAFYRMSLSVLRFFTDYRMPFKPSFFLGVSVV